MFEKDATCNFDDVPCRFIQDTNDQLDFTIYRGSTPSVNTGPSGDHTSGHGKLMMRFTIHYCIQSSSISLLLLGRYIYAEASFQAPGSRARITMYLFLRHKACLFFHYHMYGAEMGTLKVYINNRLEWKLHGNQGNRWTKATLPIQNTGVMFKVTFKFIFC